MRPLRPIRLARCLAALALPVAAGCGGELGSSATGGTAPVDPQPPTPAQMSTTTTAMTTPSPVAADPGPLSLQVLRRTALRARPGGRVLARLGRTTEFRSPTIVPVVRQRDGWYGVMAPQLRNNRIGWISPQARVRLYRREHRVTASLRRREVVVRRAGRVVMRFPVAIGAPGTPTPTGRFAVTDRLLTHDADSPYGCCILALSGHQTRTPQGWGGGDRIAIHATSAPGTIGRAASAGCLRAPTKAMRRLVRLVPLGTVVTIRR